MADKGYMAQCKECGSAFKKIAVNHIFCSRKCNYAYKARKQSIAKKTRNLVRTCGKCSLDYIRLLDGSYHFCPTCYQIEKPLEKSVPVEHKRVCKECSDVFHTKQSKQIYCSKGCRARFRYRRKRKLAIKKRTVEKQCPECGSPFKTASKLKKYCSKSCANKANNRGKETRRRAAKYAVQAEGYSPLDIILRDGEKCYICGTKTPAYLRGTFEDNAPEIDHIWPVAQGGPSVQQNLACSCRKCNQAKSDGVLYAVHDTDSFAPQQVTSKEHVAGAERILILPNQRKELNAAIKNSGGSLASVSIWLQDFMGGKWKERQSSKPTRQLKLRI